MKLLLDTHAFLWFVDGNRKLSARARALIEDPENTKSVSSVSLWEIAIKIELGRLEISRPFHEFIPSQLEANGFLLLPLRVSQMARIIALPKHHRDPFDRMLAAQCLEEEMTLVGIDSVFDQYGVPRLW